MPLGGAAFLMIANQPQFRAHLVRTVFLSILVLVVSLSGCKPAPKDQSITYTADPNAGKRMTLLLKDFDPKSMLHAADHEVPRAKYPVIDVHNHVNDAVGINGQEIPAAEVVRRMDAANVQKIVILTGLWGDKLQTVIDKMVKPYPDRFMVFTQIDYSKIDDPNFASESVAQLDDAVRRGARGVKVLKDLGLGVKDKSGKFIAVDDPRLDPIWAECGKLGIPVAIHTTDPEAFFTPVDKHNERYEELNQNPTWSFYGPQFPSKDTLLAQRNHVFEKHPHTKFIALHVANWPEDLDVVSSWLDKYPNMVVEFGARQAELGRQPRRAHKFFLDYQDRILFGTDSEPENAMYANYFRWLETGDEYFPYWGYPGQGRWEIYGLELPDSVLEKVYNKNAARLFAEFKGAPGNAK
jgi:predicted TIM-barrel fold metal-dependent hydrolase